MSNSLGLVAGVWGDHHYLEFVVDGERLGRVIGPFVADADATENYVPVLVTDWPTGQALEDLERLLGATPEPALGGRTAIYICAECGDLGCGAVTAVLELDAERSCGATSATRTTTSRSNRRTSSPA